MTEWVKGRVLCSPMWKEETKLPPHTCCIQTSVPRFPLFHVSVWKNETLINISDFWLRLSFKWQILQPDTPRFLFWLWRGQADFAAVCSASKLIFKTPLDNHPKNPFQPILSLPIRCLHAPSFASAISLLMLPSIPYLPPLMKAVLSWRTYLQIQDGRLIIWSIYLFQWGKTREVAFWLTIRITYIKV